MATFQKRGKYWRVQVRRRGYPAQSRSFDTKGAALAWANAVEHEIDIGGFQDRSRGEETTLKAALDRYAKEITPRKGLSTQKRELQRCKELAGDLLGQYSLTRLGGVELNEYINRRRNEGAGANNIHLMLALISHLYTVARSAWGMPYLINPVPLVKESKPRKPPGRNRRLLDGEEDALIKNAPKLFAPVIAWALETAMRREEIISIDWQKVNLSKKTVLLPKTKNQQARTVPLTPRAATMLRKMPPRAHGPVFNFTLRSFTRNWQKALAKAKSNKPGDAPDNWLQDLHFHDLRHEAISRIFENTDLDAMEIREISGHKTMQMLARYTHLRADRLVERLAGKRRGRPGNRN